MEQYCKQYQLPIQYNLDPNNDYAYRTVAMWFLDQFILYRNYLVPRQWMHDVDMQVDNSSIRELSSEIWYPVPQHWENDNDMTIFDQAYFGIIPDITGHRPDEQDPDGFTVAMILTLNKIDIPQQWEHNPNIQNKYGRTVAEYMIIKQIIPQKQWMSQSIANQLKQFSEDLFDDLQQWNYLPIPNWCDEQNMSIFDQACYRIIPDINNHKPNEQNEDGFTVAMILIWNNIEVPECWQHNPNIRNKYKQTAFDIYVWKKLIPPRWACRDVLYKNKNNSTQAMTLARMSIEIPEYLQHDPIIVNNNQDTVAMIQAYNGKIPDKQWEHNKFLRNSSYTGIKVIHLTVQNILIQNGMQVPQQWKYTNIVDKNDNTEEMLQAKNEIIPDYKKCQYISQTNLYNQTVASILVEQNIIPPKEWVENPEQIQDRHYQTLAMIMAQHKQQIPKYLYHNPAIQDTIGNTFAMICADMGQIPHKEWQHDPLLKNTWGDTVGILLSSHGIIPPKNWLHDINIQSSARYSIKYNLYKYYYTYINDKFVPNYFIIKSQDVCQLCFDQNQQEFVQTRCQHNICLKCFQILIYDAGYRWNKKCPICHKENWIELLEVQKEPEYDITRARAPNKLPYASRDFWWE